MGFWKREADRVEDALRGGRPDPSEDLVAALSDRVRATPVVRMRSNRGSRIAFGTALTVFMLGSFASFGGLSYAASSAKATATVVKQIVTPVKAQPTQKASAAAAQYGEEKVPAPKTLKAKPPKAPKAPTATKAPKAPPTVRVAGQSAGPPATSDTLPFTGYGLGGTAVLGSMLLLLGIILRRRESHA